MSYLIFVDKPKGLTSRQVCDEIKKIYNAKKLGHSGTLDGNASGLLLVGLDESVKAMPLFEGLVKSYEGVMFTHKSVSHDSVSQVASSFVGSIVQVPPLKSRVARNPRTRIVYEFKILEISGRLVKFYARVESGTYIRKLVDDIGKRIGGAHLKDLRRVAVGPFSLSQSSPLVDIKKNKSSCLVRLESCIGHVQKVSVKKGFLPKLINGSPIFFTWLEKYDSAISQREKLAVLCDGMLVAVGVSLATSSSYHKIRGPVVKTDRIIFFHDD